MASNDARLTWSLFALLLLPAVLSPLHWAASLAVPTLIVVLLARSLFARGSLETWAVRGLVLFAVLRFATSDVPIVAVHASIRSLGGLSLLVLTAALFRRMLAPGPIDADRLFTAANTYLVSGFAFGALYQLLELLQPGSLVGLPDAVREQSQAVTTFSFMTLTTVGYGDIVPFTPQARALASLQAAGGQLYLAVLVGRLLGLHFQGNTEATASSPRDA